MIGALHKCRNKTDGDRLSFFLVITRYALLFNCRGGVRNRGAMRGEGTLSS